MATRDELVAERLPESLRQLALSERMRDARIAVDPDEMPEPHDFERVAPYVFGQPERLPGSCQKV